MEALGTARWQAVQKRTRAPSEGPLDFGFLWENRESFVRIVCFAAEPALAKGASRLYLPEAEKITGRFGYSGPLLARDLVAF